MFSSRLPASIAVMALGIPALMLAQGEDSFNHTTLSIGAGLTTITGDSADDLNRGGNFELNGGYFFNRHVGITGNFMFGGMGITRAALDALNEPNGSARVYALTADPTLRLSLGRGFGLYVLAGGGYVRRTLHFHKPVLIGLASTHMPFMLMPGYTSAGSIVNNSGGFDVGGGLDMPSHWTTVKLFVEARYFKGFTANSLTTSRSHYGWNPLVNRRFGWVAHKRNWRLDYCNNRQRSSPSLRARHRQPTSTLGLRNFAGRCFQPAFPLTQLSATTCFSASYQTGMPEIRQLRKTALP